MNQQNPSAKASTERARRLLNRGARLLEQGKAREAIHHLERAHGLDAENVPILINLGGAYVLAGRHAEAIPFLEAARDAEPHNAMIWINLGAAYLGNPVLATPEQQMLAIAAFEKALELNPSAPSVHYNLGLIFVDREETDLATAAFRRAIQINPSDRDAHLWLQKLETKEQDGGDHES
jgi:tetratricopeptide (TPR) repeat protein